MRAWLDGVRVAHGHVTKIEAGSQGRAGHLVPRMLLDSQDTDEVLTVALYTPDDAA